MQLNICVYLRALADTCFYLYITMNQLIIQPPKTPEDFEKYFELRFRMLREPWGEVRGSEIDDEEDNSYHLMAITDNELVGVARLQFIEPNITQLRYMAVDDKCQGQGIGRLIVKHMENYARRQSAQQVILHARENAVGFYQKLDYQMIEQSYLLFGCIQHYKMSKTL